MSAWRGGWRLVYRVPLLLLHVLVVLPLTLLSFVPVIKVARLGDRSINERMQCWWSRSLCGIFGVRPVVRGSLMAGPQLIAANHISWLDIHVLHSISPMGFVAKAEIEKWPLAGWLARFGDTVFHHRGSHDSSDSVAAVMAERLRDGRKVTIFAEGGILPGHGVKRFHARFFSAAIETGSPVQPAMIRYLQNGRSYPDITFLPDEHFMTNFFRLLRQSTCTAEVAILPPIDPHGKQRREVASEAQAAVGDAFQAEPAGC